MRSLLGVTLNLYRDGNPLVPGDTTPSVKAVLVDGTEVVARYAGEPPPPLCVSRFETDGLFYWCLGPQGDSTRVLEEEFLTMLAPTTQTWTPTLAQGASSDISKTVNVANYWRIGPLVFFDVKLTSTSTGSSGSAITISPPVAFGTIAAVLGTGDYTDTGTAQYPAFISTSSTNFALIRNDVAVTGFIGGAPSIAVASGDIFYASGFYLAA